MAPSALGAFQRSRLGGFTRSTLGARDARVRQGSQIVTIISSSMAGDAQFFEISDWPLIGRAGRWYGGASTLPTAPVIPESDATLHYAAIREQAARLDRAVIVFLQIVPQTISQFDLIRPTINSVAAHAEYDFPERPLPFDAAGLQFGPDVEFHHVLVPASTYTVRRITETRLPTGQPFFGDFTNYTVNWPAVFADLPGVIDTGTIGLVFAGFHGGWLTHWAGSGQGFPITVVAIGHDPGVFSGVRVPSGAASFDPAFVAAATGAGLPPNDMFGLAGGYPETAGTLLQSVADVFEYAAEHP